MTPVLNRAETEYDSFIRDIEELAIFNNSDRIKKIEQRVNGNSDGSTFNVNIAIDK